MHGCMLTRTLTFVKNNHFGNAHFSIHAPTQDTTPFVIPDLTCDLQVI